jgi:RNA polymerase sigma-70 factor, ECF subfamily
VQTPADKTHNRAGDTNGSITVLLAEFSQGNKGVEGELAELVYGELRRLASIYMRRERGNHTLQATALVHEAWARMANGPDVAWQNRAHFYAIASHNMRRILVDHARKHRAAKRGGLQQQISLDDNLPGKQGRLVDLLALNEALDRLKAFDPTSSRIVELHFFGGLSFEEMALVLDMSTRTIRRDWNVARTWLHNELAKSSDTN